MVTKPPPIPALKFISTIIGFVVAAVVVIHTISDSSEQSHARCSSSVDLAAQHLERVTQQSTRVVKGVAAWLATNPHVMFESDRNLLALSRVMNIDPKDSHAIAIIDDDGKAWLLDEKYAGKSFDVSARPYFLTAKKTEVGEITFGPRTKNVNTGRDTIAIFYKVLFNDSPIVISTAFSVDRVKSFLTKAIGDSKSSLLLLNGNRLEIHTSVDEIPANGTEYTGEELLPKPRDSIDRKDGLFPSLEAISCLQVVKDSPFILVATADPYETFNSSIPLIMAIIVLTILAASINLLSHRRIGNLVTELRDEHQELIEAEQALRAHERYFKAIFEYAGVGLAHTSIDGQLILVNQRFSSIVGYEIEKLQSMKFAEITHPDDRASSMAAATRMVSSREGVSTMKKRYIRADGNIVWVNLTVVLIRKEKGEPDYFVSAIEDISEQVEYESDLLKAQQEAEFANAAKSEFLASMSHELRTPLNAIIGFSDMIVGEYFGPLGSGKYKEYTADIRSSGEHLLHLVNEILDLSAIEANKHQLNEAYLDAQEIIDDCSRLMEKTAIDEGIRFLSLTEPYLSPLYADPKAVKQILLNLLSNSIKFTKENGEITLSATELDGHHIFRVSDTGIGIHSEEITSITDPFVWSTSDPHKAHEGTGLGLAIVKSLVELHKGELTIKSELGQGTVVTVAIPSDAH